MKGPARVLLLGGASEIGIAILAALRLSPDAEVLLAGRDEERMAAAGKQLGCSVRILSYDATALDTHPAVVADAFADGPRGSRDLGGRHTGRPGRA